MNTQPTAPGERGQRRPWFWSRWDNWLLATLSATLGGVVVFTYLITGFGPLQRVDAAAGEALTGLVGSSGPLYDGLLILQTVTNPWVLRGIGFAAAIGLFRRSELRLAAWLATSVLLSVPVEYAVRNLVPMVQATGTEPPPSGYSLASMVVFGALSVLGGRQPGAPRRRLVAWLSGRTALLVIGVAQVALARQAPSGVLLGWLLGLLILGGCGLAFRLAQPVRRTGPGVRQPRVGVVLNPTKVPDVTDFRRQMERITAEFGWAPPLWLETTADDAGREMTHSALAAGVDLVIAAGGDGTVRVVCGEAAGTGVPVGIVPAGTGNLLVRNLGLPLDPESAIRVALTGYNRAIDLVRVTGDGLAADRFAVMAGLGMDAAVVGGAPAKLKAQMGWPAYLVSMARNVSFPRMKVEIIVDDGRPVRRSARTVIVGNVGDLHGGLPLLPDAAPDDGRIDVVMFSPRRLVDWPRLALRVLSRSPAADDQLSHWRGRRVVIRSAEPVPRQLDGDVIPPGHELRCEIEPAALLVRMATEPG